MPFLKFFSLVSLPMLFFGNAVAECVDLSGTYLCENSKIVVSKDREGENIFADITEDIDGAEVTRLFFDYNLAEMGVIPGTECTKNWIKVEETKPTYSLSVKFELREDGEVFVTSWEQKSLSGSLVRKGGQSCDRQLL